MNEPDRETKSNGNELEWAGKTESARDSFREVLASDEHEDGKAQRILTAMAFLAAAGGLIFAELNRAGIASSLKFPITNHAYVSTSFFAFIVTMVIGTLFFLAALGPAFNIPGKWRKNETRIYPRSLLFSQLILQGTLDEWENYWKKSTTENLQLELIKNYVTEAYLLAEKVRFKVINMRYGKLIYKFALGFLGMLVIPLLTTDLRQVNSLVAWIFAGIFVQDLLERAMSPGESLFSTSNIVNLAFTLIESALSLFLIISGILNWLGWIQV